MTTIIILLGSCFISYIIGYKIGYEIGAFDMFNFLEEKLKEHKNDSC